MCFKSQCETCGKPTWAGCGRHIDSALSGVPIEERCACKPNTQESYDATKGPSTCSAQ